MSRLVLDDRLRVARQKAADASLRESRAVQRYRQVQHASDTDAVLLDQCRDDRLLAGIEALVAQTNVDALVDQAALEFGVQR